MTHNDYLKAALEEELANLKNAIMEEIERVEQTLTECVPEEEDPCADCDEDWERVELNAIPDIVNVVFDNDDNLSAHVLPSHRIHPAHTAARLLFVAAEILEEWTGVPEEESMLMSMKNYALAKMDEHDPYE